MTRRDDTTFNRSNRSISSLLRLAQRAPASAREYLSEASGKLAQVGAKRASGFLQGLSERSNVAGAIEASRTQLSKLLPNSSRATEADGWDDVAARRAGAAGWNTRAQTPAEYITGTVALVDNDYGQALVLTTEGGRKYQLASSTKDSGYYDVEAPWLAGFVGDGKITVHGTIATRDEPAPDEFADPNSLKIPTFNVEGFALNRDGKFDTFTFGRVHPEGRKVYIETSRGKVEITHPELKKAMKSLERFAGIFPGEPTRNARGRLVYDKNPEEYFGLARFNPPEIQRANSEVSGRYVSTDMAWSVFSMKPLVLPARGSRGRGSADAARRVNHSNRFWALGRLVVNASGEATQFVSSYISKSTDEVYDISEERPDADPIEAAMTLAEAGPDNEFAASTLPRPSRRRPSSSGSAATADASPAADAAPTASTGRRRRGRREGGTRTEVDNMATTGSNRRRRGSSGTTDSTAPTTRSGAPLTSGNSRRRTSTAQP